MKTFEQLFEQRNPNHVFLIQRMRDAMNLNEVHFSDISSANLRLFKEYMEKEVTANSLSTYFAIIKATISEMANDGLIDNAKCTSVLKVRKTPSEHCCLTDEELIMFDEYEPRSTTESDAKILFMRGAFSGARSRDCKVMTEQNVIDGQLSYVSHKTKTGVTQPLHKRLMKYLTQQPSKTHSRSSINYAIQSICRELGLTYPVTLSRDGKLVTKPKYEWITMHASRRTYVTSLVTHGVPVTVVSKLAGHSNTTMTDHYVCSNSIPLPNEAMAFFNS